MKILAWLFGLGGIFAFCLSVLIRLTNQNPILNANASGWWRSSVALMAIAIFFSLQMRNGSSKASPDSAK
ncbi:hypothetical protein L0222_13915 [bacterium]|nr:hypothetical protein [bacterium]MCI0602082.1 hypothetical protein [bacterium]